MLVVTVNGDDSDIDGEIIVVAIPDRDNPVRKTHSHMTIFFYL